MPGCSADHNRAYYKFAKSRLKNLQKCKINFLKLSCKVRASRTRQYVCRNGKYGLKVRDGGGLKSLSIRLRKIPARFFPLCGASG